MKPVLTNIFLFLFPQILLCQVAADTAFLFEEATDDFHEFRWQAELEVISDSTFYYFHSSDGIRRIELIDSSQAVIWKSKNVDSSHSVPVQLIREKSYSIRLHGSFGMTEVMWFP